MEKSEYVGEDTAPHEGGTPMGDAVLHVFANCTVRIIWITITGEIIKEQIVTLEQ